jgi:hypothetical protein
MNGAGYFWITVGAYGLKKQLLARFAKCNAGGFELRARLGR